MSRFPVPPAAELGVFAGVGRGFQWLDASAVTPLMRLASCKLFLGLGYKGRGSGYGA